MKKNIKKNSPCPCGSGKKYKQCCLKKKSPVQEPVVHDDSQKMIPLVLLGALLLIVAGVLVYSNSFEGVFLFDDIVILNSSPLHRLWPVWDVIKGVNRPILNLTLAANYAWGSTKVGGYHLFNLIVHIATALLLFGVMRRTFLSPRLQERFKDKAIYLAFAVSLMWLVHPLNTGSVTYIVQRAESLMGMFYMLCLYSSIRFFLSKQKNKWWVFLAVLASALGLGTKEVIITAPLVIFIYDKVFFTGTMKRTMRLRWKFYFCLCGTWLVTLFLLTATKTYAGSAGFNLEGLTPLSYALTQPGVILHYLKLCVYPVTLCLDYQWQIANSATDILPALMAVSALVCVTIWALKKVPAVGFLGVWFFGILSITSSFIPIADLAFEHRMYLPLMAVVALIVLGVDFLLDQIIDSDFTRKVVSVILVSFIVLIFGRLTYARNFDYHSEIIMWQDIVNKRPANTRAHHDLGLALINAGHYEECIDYAKEAVRRIPVYAEAYNTIGLGYYRLNDFEKAKEYYRKAIELKEDYADAHSNIGLVFNKQKRFTKALDHYNKAITINPDYAEARNNLCSMLLDIGRYEEGKKSCLKAIQLKPHYEVPYNNLGAINILQNNDVEAKRCLLQALKFKPDYAKALNNLGVVYKKGGDFTTAMKLFKRALKIKPDYPDARRNVMEIENLGQLKAGRKK